eukprot:4882053-Amphidinium_carterae.1
MDQTGDCNKQKSSVWMGSWSQKRPLASDPFCILHTDGAQAYSSQRPADWMHHTRVKHSGKYPVYARRMAIKDHFVVGGSQCLGGSRKHIKKIMSDLSSG